MGNSGYLEKSALVFPESTIPSGCTFWEQVPCAHFFWGTLKPCLAHTGTAAAVPPPPVDWNRALLLMASAGTLLLGERNSAHCTWEWLRMRSSYQPPIHRYPKHPLKCDHPASAPTAATQGRTRSLLCLPKPPASSLEEQPGAACTACSPFTVINSSVTERDASIHLCSANWNHWPAHPVPFITGTYVGETDSRCHLCQRPCVSRLIN